MFLGILALLIATVFFTESQCCVLGNQNGCSDGVALGLTKQIVARLAQKGHSFKQLNRTAVHCPNFDCMLQSSAADSLVRAANQKHDFITLNSAFRSSAQQYLLYTWYSPLFVLFPLYPFAFRQDFVLSLFCLYHFAFRQLGLFPSFSLQDSF